MRNKIFVIIIMLILVIIPIGIFVRDQKEISVAENRKLSKKEDIRVSNLNEDLEKVLQDQFLYGESLKKVYNRFKTKITNLSVNVIEKNNWMKLIPVGNNLYRIANTDYLTYRPKMVNEKKENYLRIINNINEKSNNHPEIKFFVYNIVNDSTIQDRNDYDKLIIDNLNKNIPYLSSTKINTYDDYQKSFYKTDHHWNKNGQYDKVEPIGHSAIVDIKFFGSKDRMLGNYDIFDEFIVNEYDYPQMDIQIDLKEVEDYGEAKKFFNNEIPSQSVEENYYGDFYGWDNGIIEFKVPENSDKENLLIFSNSYSNPLNKLIASSFKETYVVDLRNYEIELGEKFIFEDFLKTHHIDNILILGNYNYFIEDRSVIE